MKAKTSRIIKTTLALAAIAAPSAMVFADTSGSTDVSLSIDPTLSIALSTNHIEFSADTSNFLTENMTVTGATNSANGYTISFNANNEYTSLKHSSQSVSDNIPTLSETTVVSAFPNIAWGYANSLSSASDEVSGSTNFKPIPQTSTNVFETSANGSASHIFTTGVKASNTLPAGTYSNDLLFTIVANYVEEPEGPLEPYYDVTMSNLYGLTSNIFSSTPDTEMFPYAVYAMASSSFVGDIADNQFTASGAFTVDAYQALGQWTVDMTNTGSSTAMVAGDPVITGLTDEQKEFVDVQVQYEYGTPLQDHDLIAPGETKRLLIRVTYKDSYIGSLHTGENITFSVGIPYALANHHGRTIHDGAGWLLPRSYDSYYTYKNVTSTDGRKGLSSSERPHPFMNPKADGAVVTFQTANELDLSSAVEMDSGDNYVDLSLWQDGSVIGWIEENENSTEGSKKYDYYVYSSTGEVVVDQCDQLFEPMYNNNSMFGSIISIDLHGFNFERCASAYYMFGYLGDNNGETTTIDLGDWTGQNLYYTNYMFYNAGSDAGNGANIIFSENWNPTNIRSASRMFSSVGFSSSNVSIDISGWQLNNLLDMSYMFGDLGRGTNSIININASNINIPRAKTMNSVFWSLGGNNAKSVTIDASGWTYDHVTDMGSMFSETCSSPSIETCNINIDIRTPNVENMRGMFRSTSTKLTDNIDFSKFNTSKVTDMGEMFAYIYQVGDTLSLDLSSFNTPALGRVKSFLSAGDFALKHLELDISGFDFSNLTESFGTYDRLISNIPGSVESVVIYVKDQAAKDFVVSKSQTMFGTHGIQSSEVVIK